MTQVIWSDVPAEIRAVAEPVVTRHLDLLPGWVLELVVQYDGTAERAQCTTYAEYRRAYLQLHGGYVANELRHRERTIVHELLHPVVEPTRSPLKHLLQLTGLSPTEKEIVREHMRQANEGAVCDLTALVLRLKGIA